MGLGGFCFAVVCGWFGVCCGELWVVGYECVVTGLAVGLVVGFGCCVVLLLWFGVSLSGVALGVCVSVRVGVRQI